MNDDKNKKAPEELADEALDAVAGGAGGENGFWSVACNCGATWSVSKETNETICPRCGKAWRVSNGQLRFGGISIAGWA